MIVFPNAARKFFKLNTDTGLKSEDIKKKIPFAGKLKMLVIADTHGLLDYKDFENLSDYEICFILGDFDGNDIKIIKNKIPSSIPIYGILGNHNDHNDLNYYEIDNLHGRRLVINGISIVGWQGSIKYKDFNFPSFTDKESLDFAFDLPQSDILLSHDSPKYFHGGNDFAHSGLVGITEYLKRNRVPLNIHGHHHVIEQKVLKNGTLSLCVHGCRIIDTRDLYKENI